MRNTLLSLLALGFLVVATSADAGMVKREKNDGSADWLNTITKQEYPIAVQDIQVRIVDLSTAATEEFVILRDGTVKELQCVLGAAITGADAEITLANQTTAGSQAAATQIAQITVTQSGSAVGDLDTSTGLSSIVTAGTILNLGTDGASSTTAPVHCWIVVETQ